MSHKLKIIAAFDIHFSEVCQKMESSLKGLRDRIRDAPGANVSHSDTTKSQLSAVALGTEEQLLECRQMLAALQAMKGVLSTSVQVGSLVEVGSDHDTEWYVILPKARGDSLMVEGTEITAISAISPLAKALLNRTVGEKINWSGSVFEIRSVE